MANCSGAISGYGDEIAGKICACAFEKAEGSITYDEMKNEARISDIQKILFECMEPYPMETSKATWTQEVQDEFMTLCKEPFLAEMGEEKALSICQCSLGTLMGQFESPDDMDEESIKSATEGCK